MMMMINGEDLADVIRLENYHRHFLYKLEAGHERGRGKALLILRYQVSNYIPNILRSFLELLVKG